MRCAVFGCRMDNQAKYFDKNIRFFTFPKDEQKRLEWIRCCNRKGKFNPATSRMCSKHFNPDDYVRCLKYELLGYPPPRNARALKEEAIPSNHLPFPRKGSQFSGREYRQDRRNKRQLVEDLKGSDICDVGCGKGLGRLSDNGFAKCNDYVPKISACSQSIGIDTDSKVDDRDEIIADLSKKIKFLENRLDLVGKLFSTVQLKMLDSGKCRIRWPIEDISKAMAIYATGPMSYQMLLKQGYPFPAIPILKAWLKKNKKSIKFI